MNFFHRKICPQVFFCVFFSHLSTDRSLSIVSPGSANQSKTCRTFILLKDRCIIMGKTVKALIANGNDEKKPKKKIANHFV